MKRILAMIVVSGVSALCSVGVSAQNCATNLGTLEPRTPLRSIAVEGAAGAMYDPQKKEVVLFDATPRSGNLDIRGTIPRGAVDLSIDGQILYIADGSGTLWLYNIADVRDPLFLGSYIEAASFDRVDAAGGIAVVRDSTLRNLLFLDVSNPNAIRRLDQVRVAGTMTDIAIIGTRLYVAESTNEIKIYSLEKLEDVTQVGLVRFPLSAFDRMDADGPMLLAIDTAQKVVLLIDTTGALTQVGSTPYQLLFSVALSGCTQYLAATNVSISDASGCAGGLCRTFDNSLGLLGGRFSVRAEWADSTGRKGIGHAVRLTDAAGYFWFFDKANAEVHVKMLNACVAPFNRYWFFGAGLTNVEVKLEVHDKTSGRTFTYTNPQGTAFAPIQDTSTLDVCP